MASNRRKSDIDRRRKNRKRLAFGLVLFFGFSMMLSFLFGEKGFMGYLRMEQKHSQLRQEIQHLKNQNKKLYREADALRNDPDYIEALARDRLGMIKKGEMVYQFEKNQEEPDR